MRRSPFFWCKILQTTTFSTPKFAIPFSVALLTLTACSGNNTATTAPDNTTTVDSSTVETAPIDWTGRACESPFYENTLGTYGGDFIYQDSAPRACRWSGEITITGVSEPDSGNCNLSGTVTATLTEQGTQLDNAPYVCAVMNSPVFYVADEAGIIELNTPVPSSFIVQLDEGLLPGVDENGIALQYPVTQFEAFTVGGGSLITNTSTLSIIN